MILQIETFLRTEITVGMFDCRDGEKEARPSNAK